MLTAWGPPVIAGVVGSFGSRRAPNVYARLEKPVWAPPAWLFGPVWTALYASIGVAGRRMVRDAVPPRLWGLHGGQLLLNAAWPWVFFTVRDKRASLTVIAMLDAVLAAEIAALAPRDRLAASVLAPYLGWSLFATALNARVSEPGEPR